LNETVSLSLISHTNVGKTTLARTLLRRDVGEVRDAAHVTGTSDTYLLVASPQGDELRLWDTPGFGDSARLLKRLRQAGNPLGWFLTQVWDRYVDRPFFSSQQAVRNVRDEADVVLYLVNAAEDPAARATSTPRCRSSAGSASPWWCCLTSSAAARAGDRCDRRAALGATPLGHACVRDTVAFDAFARCWVQEHVLLDRVGAVLPQERRAAFDRLADAWRARNRETFERSMQVLARQLAADCRRRRGRCSAGRRRDGTGAAHDLLGARQRGDAATDIAMGKLAQRLDAEVRRATDDLIALHGLSGRASDEILQRMGAEYAVDKGGRSRQGEPHRGGRLGRARGLARTRRWRSDVRRRRGTRRAARRGRRAGLASVYNLARGSDATTVRWSGEFLTGRASGAVLRYLAWRISGAGG